MQKENPTAIPLCQLMGMIRRTLDQAMPMPYFVTAEIQSLSVNRSGHAYLELVEKSESGDRVLAQARATIWATQYRMIKAYFETATGRLLQPGIKIMVKAKVSFHEIYGLSINITDILPEYTVGELAMQRQRTIDKLKADGIFDMNKQLQLPMLVKRIAVISSAGAAGYGDFLRQLDDNPYGYSFITTLYEAAVQGDGASSSIIPQLDRIAELRDQYDCVAIIRGGGSKSDLACFDNLDICQHVCQFPLPVITGIGHDRDESIADLVANTALKTPTAVAQFLIDRMHQCDMRLMAMADNIKSRLLGICPAYLTRIDAKGSGILHKISMSLTRKSTTVDMKQEHITNLLNTRILQAKSRLQSIETVIEANSPQAVLKKGYAYVVSNGKIVTSASQIAQGDHITTVFIDGKIESTVDNKTTTK